MKWKFDDRKVIKELRKITWDKKAAAKLGPLDDDWDVHRLFISDLMDEQRLLENILGRENTYVKPLWKDDPEWDELCGEAGDALWLMVFEDDSAVLAWDKVHRP